MSRIYVGRQKMNLEQARVFAQVLGVSLSEVMDRAGIAPREEAEVMQRGFSETDAQPFTGKPGEGDKVISIARNFGGGKPGVDVWQAKSRAMAYFGILPGDMMLVDTTTPETCKKGDTVIAQVYDWQTGTAETVLRRYQPPVLIGFQAEDGEPRTHVVDGQNVVIRGKVIASWRACA
ncbi:hypothetical protein [Roseovarius atlanticus]|uniref:hypothetical protein n=1 Tax=Roseovarius atlanticus TaxID=1641875 RepID=UPI001C97D984|nr:hypothetical protein [Roseovarius atlanticus]MBY6123581.1 hypothetical protein [Roseovarius atlanticus]MBY6148076.1 hypothetical protein [Roseovarius atlanticus]